MPRNPISLFTFARYRKEDNFFFFYFHGFIAVSLLAIIIYAWHNEHWFTIVSTSFVISIASCLVGLLFGFIFGFPYHENEKHNQSFKEVTEWLTKIIIGLGLVELKKLYHLFNVDVLALSSALNVGIDLSVLFGALIIGYAIMGFLIGYCVTITEIFKWIVRNNLDIDDMRAKSILKPVPPSQDNPTVEAPNEGGKPKIDEANLQELVNILGTMKDYTGFDIVELKKMAGPLYKGKYYEMAAKAYEACYEKDKSDYFSLMNAGYIYSKKLFRHELANQLIQKIIDADPKYGGAYYNKACNFLRMNDLDNAKENIKLALENDAALDIMAVVDDELEAIRPYIEELIKEIRKK